MLFIVSDATVRGITTAGRVAALLAELDTKVGAHYLIVNRAADGLSPELEAAIAEHGLNLLAVLPDDPQVAAFDAAGRPLVAPARRQPAQRRRCSPSSRPCSSTTERKEATGAHHR